MICTRLEGGLGNQLFQYAAGRALAYRHGTDLLLDTERLAFDNPKVTKRSLEMHRFKHAARVLSPGECNIPTWLRYVPTLSHLVTPWRLFVEKSDTFNSRFQKLPDQTYLHGYWQSHRYFEDISDTIYRELAPIQPLSQSSLEVATQIEATNRQSVAVHVRRGDYASLSSAASFHGTLPTSYYGRALEYMYERMENPKLFVFSDDTNWCRSNLPLKQSKVVFVDHNIGDNAWQDLALMSLCRQHIVANSSFSWWGAWLADQRWQDKQRLVIAPLRWFARRNIQSIADRFPQHWVLL